MSSGESGKVKRVVLLALVCAGCAAAPVIALRETPEATDPVVAPAAVVADQAPAPAVSIVETPAIEPPIPATVEIAAVRQPEPDLNDRLRGMTFG